MYLHYSFMICYQYKYYTETVDLNYTLFLRKPKELGVIR